LELQPVDQEYAWDGREPSEDEPHFYSSENRASIHATNVQAREALLALLKRSRKRDTAKAKLDGIHA
jgi:hypothetical protein